MRAHGRRVNLCPHMFILASVLCLPNVGLYDASAQAPGGPGETPGSANPPVQEEYEREVLQRNQFAERLRLVKFPSWARDTAISLFFARERPERIEPTDERLGSPPQASVEINPEDYLCALDSEIDLLAAALLALREPDAVLNLYKLWYANDTDYFPQSDGTDHADSRNSIVVDSNEVPDPKNWRTPAAPLIFAQAYRLRAWLRFFPRPDQTFQIAEDSRVELFFRANKDLSKAAGVLSAALGSFAEAGKGAPKFDDGNPDFKFETLARWTSHYKGSAGKAPGGLPKPRTIADVRGANPHIDASILQDTNAADRLRAPLPAFRAVEFAVSYQEWLCRIYRELGDLVYRETGRSVAAQYGGSSFQSTALAWYSLARDHCYAGRLINYEHRGLRVEARELKDRLAWVLANRAFGGHELWRLSPVSTRNYVTPAMQRLDVTLATLGQLREKDAQQTANQLAVATDLQQRTADRKQLDQFYRAQAQRELTSGIMDLKSKITAFEGDMAREDLERAEYALQNYLLESGVGLSQQQYLGELERLQHQWLHQILVTAQQLAINGGFQAASETSISELELAASTVGETPDLMSRMPEVERPDQDAINTLTQFFESLHPSPTQAELLKTWDRIWRPSKNPEVPRTTAAIRYAEWRAADLERELANLRWSLLKTKVLLREHQERLDRLKELDNNTNTNLGNLWTRFREKQALAVSSEEARQLETEIKPRLQEEVQHATNHLRRAVSELKKYQEKLAQVRSAVEQISQARAKVEQAYESFVSLIQTAKEMPTIVAAGMATGTMFDSGDAIASGAEAVMQKLEGVLSGQIKAAELEAEITNAETTVAKFLDNVDLVEKELRGKRAELEKAFGTGRVLADYQPGGRIHTQFLNEERRLNETKRELETEIQKTEAQVQNAQAFIDAADERELEIVYVQSVANARAALGRLVGVYDQRDQLVGKLLSLKAQWDGLAQERQAAQELVADFRRSLAENKQKLAQATDAWTHTKAQREALSRELQAQVLAFDAERRELLRPARRMLTAELLESMAPALAMASLNALPREQQELLDSANADLITIARWLYVLTGQERMATLGSPCQSLYELKLARKELDQAWQDFQHLWSGAKLQASVLTFSANECNEYFVGDHLVFRSYTTTPDNPISPVNDQREWLFGDANADAADPVWEYSPQTESGGVPAFYLTHTSRQGMHGSLLHGVWAICEWENPKGQGMPTVENLPDAYPSLRRAGMVRVRNGSGLTTLPFYSAADELPEPGVLAPFSTRRDVRQHFLRLARSSSDLVVAPLIDPLANRYFGHGLDQTWVFELKEHRDKLRAVHVVLTYLLPPGRLQRDEGLGDMAGQMDGDFLKWIGDYSSDEIPKPPPQRESIAAARSAALNSLRKWRDSQPGGVGEARKSLETFAQLLTNERDARAAAQLSLQNGLGVQQGSNTDANPAAQLTSIVQPISITDQLTEASALLNLLEGSLQVDYFEPLNEAATILSTIRCHRKRLQDLAERLREQNEHRKVLADYVDFLEEIVETVRGENLTGFEQARLNTLLDGHAWDHEVENILWDKAAEMLREPTQRDGLVEYILTEVGKLQVLNPNSVPWGRLRLRLRLSGSSTAQSK